MSDTRIVLVKPGDVLMLGNVTLPELASDRDLFLTALQTLKETLGLAHDILVFEDDIDLAVKPGNVSASDSGAPEYHVNVNSTTPHDTAEHIRHGLDYINRRYGKGRA